MDRSAMLRFRAMCSVLLRGVTRVDDVMAGDRRLHAAQLLLLRAQLEQRGRA